MIPVEVKVLTSVVLSWPIWVAERPPIWVEVRAPILSMRGRGEAADLGRGEGAGQQVVAEQR